MKKNQGATRVKCQQLQTRHKEFEILFIKLEESIEDYFSRTLAIADKMCIHNEKIEDVAMEEKIVIMAPKFMFVVCSIE